MNKNQGQRRTLDWNSVHQRIAEASAALKEMEKIEPEAMKRIWAQRATQLAKPPIQEEKGGQIELTLLQLGREVYGIEIQHIVEIRPAMRITRVPRVPEWVIGVVNMRGRILPVLDLRRFFGLDIVERKEENTLTSFLDLVVVEAPAMEVALLAEDVLAIELLPLSRLQEVTETIRGVSSEYVRGVIERGLDTPIIVVLDLPALLADERLIIQEEVA